MIHQFHQQFYDFVPEIWSMFTIIRWNCESLEHCAVLWLSPHTFTAFTWGCTNLEPNGKTWSCPWRLGLAVETGEISIQRFQRCLLSWNILEHPGTFQSCFSLENVGDSSCARNDLKGNPQWGLFDQPTWSYDTFVLLCNVIERLSIAELHRSITFKSSHGPPSVTPSWSEMVATSSWSRIWKRRSKNFRRHSPTAFASRAVCFWENLAYESV